MTFRPGGRLGYGSWQGRRPFHRKSEGTDCKKAFQVLGPSRRDQAACLRRVMFWLVRWNDYPRQSSHLAFEPSTATVPSYSFLSAANTVTLAPTRRDVIPDTRLNTVPVPLHIMPPDSWQYYYEQIAPAAMAAQPVARRQANRGRAGGRGRGRTSRGGGGRNAGSAHGSSAEVPARAASSSSKASSSSTSSSESD